MGNSGTSTAVPAVPGAAPLSDHEIKSIDTASHDSTPKRKGKPKKSGFKGTLTKKETTINWVTRIVVDTFQENKAITENNTQSSHKISFDVANPVGLVNYAHNCFFDSSIQVLFSLKYFVIMSHILIIRILIQLMLMNRIHIELMLHFL